MSALSQDEQRDTDCVLEVRDTTVTFEMDRGTSRVLDDVSIDIHRGEIVGIVGESGSGKSMFASALMDAVVDPGVLDGNITYYPKDGETVDILSLSDEELRKLRWEQIAMVFQGAMSSFNPVMKIRTHFRETLKAHDYDVDEGMQRAKELLSDLYLDPDRVLDSYPHELSGGMSQRTLIGLSLILEPEVLVMDEPTAALDLLMQRSILSLLRDLQEKYDLTLIFITHDLPLVTKLADRIAVMYAFQFVEFGPTKEMLLEAAHPYTRALLRSTPNIDMSADELNVIDGSSPDPVAVPDGCSYHPRCPLADEQCRTFEPALTETDQDHSVACHHWEQSAEAVPVNLTGVVKGEPR